MTNNGFWNPGCGKSNIGNIFVTRGCVHMDRKFPGSAILFRYLSNSRTIEKGEIKSCIKVALHYLDNNFRLI